MGAWIRPALMQAPTPLLQRLQTLPGMEEGRRLVLLFSQLGDFDSMEYAQALAPELPRLEAAGLRIRAIAIGSAAGAERFCRHTGFPRAALEVDAEPTLHRQLGLYAGLQTPGGPWPALLLMCAGIGSPGTLREVLRGYSGDRTAPQRIANEATVQAGPLPPIPGSLFRWAGGEGFQRPFELATIRLRNMAEVLGHWRTYVPRDDFITQRGGTFLLDADNTLLYSHRDPGILGFSATMNRPLSFLDPYLADAN
jgi:hypothetical protein